MSCHYTSWGFGSRQGIASLPSAVSLSDSSCSPSPSLTGCDLQHLSSAVMRSSNKVRPLLQTRRQWSQSGVRQLQPRRARWNVSERPCMQEEQKKFRNCGMPTTLRQQLVCCPMGHFLSLARFSFPSAYSHVRALMGGQPARHPARQSHAHPPANHVEAPLFPVA